MKVVVIGATGTIGQAIVELLSSRHEVVKVARSSGEFQVDMTDKESIHRLFEAIAPFDAVISAAGSARFNSLESLSDEDFQFSLANKLMGQINVVRVGLPYITDGGSFTVTSGVLATEPIPGSAAISLVNAGLEGFARAAALEMPRGVRINVVSPPWVTETLQARNMDLPGGMPAAQVAVAYQESLASQRSGEVLDARLFG
ncbi:MAG: short chain dehydrogenase [Elainellaceae cyanobacterium]